MSGHNPPHGRMGQPNTTWNPLQVPSYVPRQPQLAHMSSERSMARSPLTWPNPPTTHQDKVYNLMTGNLMNNLEMNPLLQGYGRNVGMPLGSVDLSLSSASRSTPSPKGVHNNIQTAATSSHSSHTSSSSTTLPSNIPTSGVHSMAGDSGLSGSNHQTRTSVPSSGGVIQSTTVAALKERMQGTGGMPSSGAGSTSNAFGMTNTISDGSNSTMGANIMRGGNGFGAGLNNRTANDLAALVSGGLFVKDAKQINSEMDSKNGRDCFSHLSCTESADLVKEFVLQTMHCTALSVSPKRTSPARSSAQSALSPNRSRSPPLNLLLGPSAIDGKLDCLNSSFPLPSNNASVPLSLSSDSTAPSANMDGIDVGTVTARALGSLLSGTAASELATGASTPCQLNPSASPTGNSMASSEDSIDSSNSRSNNNARRRRKPEKTNKMNAAFPLEEGKSLFPVAAKPTDGGMAGLDELDSLRSNHTARNDITALAIEGINALSHGLSGTQCELSQSQPPLVNMPDSNASGHSTPHDIFLPLHAQRKPLPGTPQDQQQKLLLETLIQSNMNNNGTATAGSGLQPLAAGSSGAVSDEAGPTVEGTTSDCETIDKIAAMVSSTNALATKLLLDKVTESTNDNGIANCNGPAQQLGKSTPHEEKKGHKGEKKANASDSSYEEVENKLEEMFAGIEEQSGNGVESIVQKQSPNAGDHRCSPNATVATNEHGQTDGDVMKQLSNDLLAGQCETTNHPASDAARSSNGSGKKPLTPAQKRSIGSKTIAQSGDSIITSTPAPVKRKRGPKKKSNAHSKPSFMEPEGSALLGLKALNNKKKGKGVGTGKKGSKGAKGKGSKSKNRELTVGAAWSAGGSGAGFGVAATAAAAAASTSIDPNGKYKGPYVQVKADGCHTVINAPLNEEDSDKTQNKTKKFGNSLNSSERSKIRGLHVSTLSTKYDADTTDTSWMCVFCKTGPHKFRLGDLFGPYIISTTSSEYEQSQVDVDYFSVRRTREDLESNQARQKRAAEKLKEQHQSGSKSKKRKNATGGAVNAASTPLAGPSSSKELTLKEEKCDDVILHRAEQQTSIEIFYGMIKASDNTYEVWTHEDCLVWAPGVYMVGTRIVGLEAAIWNCCRHQCQFCRHYGAVLSCLHQGCHAKAHYICAHKQSWKMTEDFQSFCQLHAGKPDLGDSGDAVASSSREVTATVTAAAAASPAQAKQLKKEGKSGKAAVSLTTSAS